jgi:hypothetical protein
MVRTEISLFLKNIPGELGRLASLFSTENINIDALTIQDASSYVQNLFEARGKSLKRIASVASYNSMRKDSAQFALIRMLVDQTDKAIDLLSKNDYLFDIMPVMTLELENKPGSLAAVANKFVSLSSVRKMSIWLQKFFKIFKFGDLVIIHSCPVDFIDTASMVLKVYNQRLVSSSSSSSSYGSSSSSP